MVKAVSQEFLNEGANVVVCDMNPEAPTFETNENSGKLLYVVTNVTSMESVQSMVDKTVETFGSVDVLVNNAGINIPRLLVDPKDPKGQFELDEAVWDKVVNVNFKGVFFFVLKQQQEKWLKKGEGVIVNMSSESGLGRL